MKRLLTFFKKTALYMLIILAGMLVIFYLMAPVYSFRDPQPFSGKKLYNPYASLDSTHWRQYNFQVQSKVWFGLTNGNKNTNRLIDSIYGLLNYDYVATSDYQAINRHGNEKPSYIPTYEHGYNLFKIHQVCIGAEKVLWTDLILFQTTSMKQWIIDHLAKECDIVALAHPVLRNGYSLDDMKYLSRYQLIEALSNSYISLDHWDMALSSGHQVWILASDDTHDVLSSSTGRKFTLINSPTTNREDIIANLKKGNAAGVDFFPISGVTFEERIAHMKFVPKITSFQITGDTISLSSDLKADTVKFIGQNGTLLKTVTKTRNAQYVVRANDTYVRTVLKYGDGTFLYLNPVIRYEGDFSLSKPGVEINKTATLLLRIFYFLFALTIIYLFRRRKINYNQQN